MATKSILPPGEPTLRRARLTGGPEPHRAVAVLLDHRVPLLDLYDELLNKWEHRGKGWQESLDARELFQIERWVHGDPEQAMACFGEETLGWVPWWFPRVMHLKEPTDGEEVVDLTPEQRLEWFDKALEYCSGIERLPWPPEGSLREMKIAIGTSLLEMLREVDEYELPGIDQM